MGTTKTQIVKYIRKGDKGDAGTDAVTMTMTPETSIAKYDSAGTITGFTSVTLAMYDGTTNVTSQTTFSIVAKYIGLSASISGNTLTFTALTSGVAGDSTVPAKAQIEISGTYNGLTLYKTHTITTVKDGDQGDKGEQGAVLRGPQAWSDCATGYAFQAGGSGESWKDVVLYNSYYYSCVKSHTKTETNYPGSTEDTNNGYWQLGDNIELVATKILLATYALVENLGVTAIQMKDSDGNVIFEAKDGAVTCNTGNFNSVNIESGKIAGFTISGNGLSNTPFENDAYVIFRNDDNNTFAGIGGNVLPTSSGLKAVARFENHDTGDFWGLGTNYGMLLSARGMRTNIALAMDGGAVSGLAMKNTIISTTTTAVTLSRTDYNVLAINTKECTITLPTMQLYDDGHVIRIKRLGDGALKIRMGYCYTYNGTSTRYTRPIMIYNQNNKLTGTDTLSFTSVCDAMELVWVRDINYTVNSVEYYGAWVQYKLPRDW